MTLVVLGGTVRFPPDRLEEARAAIRDVVRHSRAEDGCGAYVFSEDMEEPGLFHVFEEWRDDDALKAHYATAHFLAFRTRREALGMSDRRIKAYSVASARET